MVQEAAKARKEMDQLTKALLREEMEGLHQDIEGEALSNFAQKHLLRQWMGYARWVKL